MIIIDGAKSDLSINNYANLEEALIHISKQDCIEMRVVTDVLVNNEPFSELYPHQAEDIDTSEVKSLELKTITATQLSYAIIDELPKVIAIINSGAENIAKLFRSGELTEGLELLQDVIDVSRDLLQTLAIFIQNNYSESDSQQLKDFTTDFSALITETSETMVDEDWILAADLLQYELAPTIQKLSGIIASIKTAMDSSNAQ